MNHFIERRKKKELEAGQITHSHINEPCQLKVRIAIGSSRKFKILLYIYIGIDTRFFY